MNVNNNNSEKDESDENTSSAGKTECLMQQRYNDAFKAIKINGRTTTPISVKALSNINNILW